MALVQLEQVHHRGGHFVVLRAWCPGNDVRSYTQRGRVQGPKGRAYHSWGPAGSSMSSEAIEAVLTCACPSREGERPTINGGAGRGSRGGPTQ